jgi:DegV family protein with EDD domain
LNQNSNLGFNNHGKISKKEAPLRNDQKITIVTDSSTYIPESALVGLDVAVIPLWLIWEGESLLDGIDIDQPTFYQRLRTAKTLPTSSQPTVQEFMKFFRKVSESCDVIVNVLVSSKISGTVTNAMAAKKNLPKLDIHLVDTLSSSMGAGHIVLAAARAAAAGMSVDKVIAAAEKLKEKINFIFVVDTLEYLHKGGRIGGAKRYLGTALRVKPLLEFRDGQIEPMEQVRTKRKAIARLLEIADERLSGKPMAEATIVDIDCPGEGDAVAKMVAERFAPKQIHRSGVSPVVGTHVGPGAIGLAFYPE